MAAIVRWAALAALTLAAVPAVAQTAFTPSAELVEAAKKEGKLSFFCSNFLETEQELARRFNQRFPFLRIELVRAPGGQLITRVKTEAAAGRLSADMIDISDRAQAAGMSDLFAPYAPPNAGDYPPATRTGDRLWPRSANAWTIAWNPALVPNPPKSWHDLTKEEYARLGIARVIAGSGGAPWGLAMFERQVFGEDYWQKAAATKPRLFPSQAPMVDAIIRGEVALAALVTNLSIPLERQGAPLKWTFAPEGVPVTVFAAGVTKTAPNPNAAKLYMDWALSREGQTAMVDVGNFSAMTNAPLPPGVDPAAIKPWLPDEAQYEKLRAGWTEEWNKIFNYRQ